MKVFIEDGFFRDETERKIKKIMLRTGLIFAMVVSVLPFALTVSWPTLLPKPDFLSWILCCIGLFISGVCGLLLKYLRI